MIFEAFKEAWTSKGHPGRQPADQEDGREVTALHTVRKPLLQDERRTRFMIWLRGTISEVLSGSAGVFEENLADSYRWHSLRD